MSLRLKALNKKEYILKSKIQNHKNVYMINSTKYQMLSKKIQQVNDAKI